MLFFAWLGNSTSWTVAEARRLTGIGVLTLASRRTPTRNRQADDRAGVARQMTPHGVSSRPTTAPRSTRRQSGNGRAGLPRSRRAIPAPGAVPSCLARASCMSTTASRWRSRWRLALEPQNLLCVCGPCHFCRPCGVNPQANPCQRRQRNASVEGTTHRPTRF